MAKKIIKAQMKQRRDTFANWAAENPVLLDGELGIVSDDPNLYKVGDGSAAWNALPFRGFDGTLVQEEGTSANAAMSQKAVTEALAKKIDADGHYPKLHAGKADDLAGHGESTPEEFTFRASGGRSIKDGSATIKELDGNAVVWNQWVDTIAAQDCDLSETDNRLTLTPQGTFPGVTNTISMNIVENHVYICISHRIGGGFLNVNCGGYDVATNVPFRAKQGHYGFTVYSYNETQPFTITRPRLVDLTQMFQAGNEPTTIEEFNARKSIVADEYAYNPGQVIAFHGDAIKSVGDNAWDEQWERGDINLTTGENMDSTDYIRSKNYIPALPNQTYHIIAQGVGRILYYDENYAYIGKSESFGGTWDITTPMNCRYMRYRWEGQSYNGGIMIRLDHSGWKSDIGVGYEPYWEDTLQIDSRIKAAFPQGAHKWDKVYNKDGKGYIVKGTGAVDLGALDWSVMENNGRLYFKSSVNQLDAVEPEKLNRTKAYGICSAYEVVSYLKGIDIYNGVGDKVLLFNHGYFGNVGLEKDLLVIYDSSYTDVESFKAMLQEKQVILYYELAEPEVLEFDKAFDLDYKVADFGTEELLASQPSAPFKGRTIYQFNAVDQIRDNAERIAQLEALLTAMQAQLTSLINGGQ